MTIKIEPITVELVSHHGDDLLVVNAARASFGKSKSKLDDKDYGLINYLAMGYRSSEWDEMREDICTLSKEGSIYALNLALRGHARRPQHWLPFAHPHITLRITVPVFLARQLVKHQVGGVWSEESRRYISEDPAFWMPDEWHTRPDDIKQGSGSPVITQELCDLSAQAAYEESLLSYRSLLSRGVAPEEARAVLPLAHMTTAVWTGSLAFWARVYIQRSDSGAQLAAQEFAQAMGQIMAKLFPVSWPALTA